MNITDNKLKKKRRRTLTPFLLGSILLHIIILFLFLLYLLYFGDRQEAKTKDKPEFIEITELPVPKEKETEPPNETERLAERSHKTDEEKTKDEFTKSGSVVPAPKLKPQPPTQSKKVKTAKEKTKKETSPKKSPKIASLPKETQKKLEPPKEELKKDGPEDISKEELFSSIPRNYPERSQKEFQGSRDEEKTEDTVDLNTTEFKYLSYFLKLKRQIEGVWHYPETSRLRGEQGELFLVFTIKKDGYLEDVKLLDSSGYTRLDQEAIRAIRIAGPYPPFPNQWGSLEKLNVRAVFSYQLSYRGIVR